MCTPFPISRIPIFLFLFFSEEEIKYFLLFGGDRGEGKEIGLE